jgi:lysozyme
LKYIKILIILLISGYSKSQVTGIDVSRYQGKIDWSRVDTSIKFVIAKKSEGITLEDTWWRHNIQTCNRPIGVYHFFRPQYDGIQQSRFFLTGFSKQDVDILPVIDVESCKYWNSNGIQNLQSMIFHIFDSLGVWPIIYTNSNFWNKNLNGKLGLGECILWIADWRGSTLPQVPEDFCNWKIWQHTSRGRVRGITGYVDKNLAYLESIIWK